MKEAKAVFLYTWMHKINPKILYERTKDFLLLNFQEHTCFKNMEIVKEGDASNKLIILKEGTFMLAKSLHSMNPFDRKTGNI